MEKVSKALILIILLAVLLRVGAAFYLGDQLGGPGQERIFDQVSYQALAESILGGRGYSFEKNWYPFTPAGEPTAHWSFVYPLFLTGVYSLFGLHPLAARLVQVVISGLLSTWLVYRLGRRLFGEAAGLLAALLMAVYAYFVYHDAALMTESFFIAGVLASTEIGLQLAGQRDEKTDLGLWLALGVVLGITALLRQTILLWMPFLLGWIWWSRRLRAAKSQPAVEDRPAAKEQPSTSAGGYLPPVSGTLRKHASTILRDLRGPVLVVLITGALILPWTVRNALVYHAFLPLNSNAGYALYSANHPHHGTYFDQDYAAPLPPELKTGQFNEARLNTELTKRGIEFVLQDPGRYALLSLSRVGIFFNFWFSSESSLASSLMRILSFGLYLPFFLLGLIFSWRQRQRASLIYLFAIVYSLMHILTWASVRYRLPVDAVLMPFAALALVEIYAALKSRMPAFLSPTPTEIKEEAS